MVEQVIWIVLGLGAMAFGLIGSIGFGKMLRDDAIWSYRFGGKGHRIFTMFADLVMLAMTIVAFLIGFGLVFGELL